MLPLFSIMTLCVVYNPYNNGAKKTKSRYEEEAMSVRDREDYLQNELNRFQSRIQSMTQEHFFSTEILQLKNRHS